MIDNMLKRFPGGTDDDRQQALREVMQEITLAGLYRAGFFEKAAFYGGTCLRIFHGLSRYSEDLDFSLLKLNPDFRWQPYLDAVQTEFKALGVDVSIREKIKSNKTTIESAFLKNETSVTTLEFSRIRVKIKLEIDTQPPLGFATEELLLIEPFSCYVKCFSLPDLYAGKLHAVLYRQWKHRVKGRDWYDFIWYTSRRIAVNEQMLAAALAQTGPWAGTGQPVDRLWCLRAIEDKIKSIDWRRAREDVRAFVRQVELPSLDLWSRDFFLAQASKLPE